MSSKFFPEALVLSAALHALGVYSVYGPLTFSDQPDKLENIIQVSYVELKKETPALPPKTVSKPRSAWKSVVSKPVPTQAASTPKSWIPSASAAVTTRSSAELLRDPAQGKIFSGYFSQVKDKIRRVVEKRYGSQSDGRGTVALYFVLNADGQLEAVSALRRQSVADEFTQELAKDCVRLAAPFGKFPSDLSMGKISFNVTIQFEDR